MCFCFFFFKHKTSYDLRFSDWSSDVCSSDLKPRSTRAAARTAQFVAQVRPLLAADRVSEAEALLKDASLDSDGNRSEDRRVGEELGSTCRSRWSQDQ